MGVDSIRDKLAESRLRWFGHVSRMQSDDVVKKVWRWDSVKQTEQTWNAVVKKRYEEEVFSRRMGPRSWRMETCDPYPYPC